jgi:cystathionine beta-synthase
MTTFNNILETIGNTPIVRINKLAQNVSSTIYAKMESMNPGGSIKDRIGKFIIEKAEKSGELKPGGTVIEATSGNTGVGLAITSAIKGYKTIFVMPDKMSQEKIRNLRTFGARVIITPTDVAPEDPKSYYSVAKRIVDETKNSFYSNQYYNPANPQTHYEITGPEIWKQMGDKLTTLVCGMGTGGTISGIGKYLKEKNPKIKVAGVDPIGSLYYEYFKTKKMGQAKPYKIEGIGEDILPGNMDFKVVDEVVQVTDKESFLATRNLVTQEGMFVGGSSGAALMGAIKYAKTLKQPEQILVIFPDAGDRYLSKIFNDNWLKEYGFLESKVDLGLVRDLITHMGPQKIITAQKTNSMLDVIRTMREHGFSQLPVMDKGNKLLGIVTEADLLHHVVDHNHKADDPVERMLSKNFAQASLDESVENISEDIDNNKFVVVYEGDTLHAIITKIDLLSYYSKRLK